MTLRALLALCLLALPAHADEAGSQPGLLLTEWTLISVDGQAVSYQATINLAEPGRATGQGPCNRYFAGVEGSLPAFHLKSLGSTKMACPDMGFEAAYFSLLSGIETAAFADKDLVLGGAGHELTFRKTTE